LLEKLHECIAFTHEPNVEIADFERVDALGSMIWELCLSQGLKAHVCPDRYCSCHLVLWDREPESPFPWEEIPKHSW
jgi:hypothetical protein